MSAFFTLKVQRSGHPLWNVPVGQESKSNSSNTKCWGYWLLLETWRIIRVKEKVAKLCVQHLHVLVKANIILKKFKAWVKSSLISKQGLSEQDIALQNYEENFSKIRWYESVCWEYSTSICCAVGWVSLSILRLWQHTNIGSFPYVLQTLPPTLFTNYKTE